MSSRRRGSGVARFPLALTPLAAMILLLPSAKGSAMAIAGLFSSSFTRSGVPFAPEAVCALAYTGLVQPPMAGGQSCDDVTPIVPFGADQTTFMNPARGPSIGEPAIIGLRAAGRLVTGEDPTAFARNLVYNVTTDNNKQDAAQLPGMKQTIATTANDLVNLGASKATASQTVDMSCIAGAGSCSIHGAATASYTKRPALAVGFVHDPLIFQPDDSHMSDGVDIGFDPGLELQAVDPGDFAAVYVEAVVNEITLFAFQIGVTGLTTSLTNLDLQCLSFNLDPSGCAAFGSYFNTAIAPFLNFDAETHTLSSASSIPLVDVPLPAGSDSALFLLNYHVLVAGSDVPEPGTACTCLLACLTAMIALQITSSRSRVFGAWKK